MFVLLLSVERAPIAVAVFVPENKHQIFSDPGNLFYSMFYFDMPLHGSVSVL